MGPTPTRTARLDEFLVEIAAGTDFPAVSSAIEQVLAKTAEEASIQRITNVILKDYSITLKILRTANSAFYNRSGRPIISISHAVSLLGLDTVRQIVTGLVLIEQFSRRSPGLKELMLLSLLSANHAREVADFVGYARPEEAYLCGMLRNLGEVLVGCFRPREYAAILLRVHEDRCPVEQPSLEILGFRYEEAGVAVAVLWAIPASVQASMSEPVFHLRNAQDSDAERLKSITYFAHKLTNAVYRREPGSARASVKPPAEQSRPNPGFVGGGCARHRRSIAPGNRRDIQRHACADRSFTAEAPNRSGAEAGRRRTGDEHPA